MRELSENSQKTLDKAENKTGIKLQFSDCIRINYCMYLKTERINRDDHLTGRSEVNANEESKQEAQLHSEIFRQGVAEKVD